MGIDWIPMRLKPGAYREAVLRLIAEQALAYRILEQHFYKEHNKYNREHYYDKSYLGEHYVEVISEHTLIHEWYSSIDEALRAKLDIEGDNHRVRGFTYTLIIPVEWRFHAYRTFLPDELPEHLKIWKSYVKAVENGEYQDYLRQLYMCHKSSFLHFAWRRLRDESESFLLSSDAMTQPSISSIYEQIEQLPCPNILPFPRWNNGQAIDPKQQARIRTKCCIS